MWMTKSFWAHSSVWTHGHYLCMVVFWHVTIPGLITDMLSSSFRVYFIKSHARHKQDRAGEGKRETVSLRPIYRQYMWFGTFSLWSCAQSTLSWPSANVRTIFIFRSFYAFFQSKTLMYNNNCHTPDSCLKRALINTPPQKQFIPTHFHTLSLESSKETLKRFLFYKNAVKTALWSSIRI